MKDPDDRLNDEEPELQAELAAEASKADVELDKRDDNEALDRIRKKINGDS